MDNGATLHEKISEYSSEEMLLRESEERSREIVRASPLAMVVSRGPRQTVEVVNDKFINLFGYTIEDMPDVEHWWPLAYPVEEYREIIKAQWETRIGAARRHIKDIDPMEARVRCKDGSQRDVEFHISTLGDAFLVSFVDLTARKAAEIALRASEERFRQAAEAGRMYACVWDAASNMVTRSAECQNVLGSGAVMQAPLSDVRAAIHPEDLGGVDEAINALQPEHPTSRVTYRSRKTDGTQVWLEQSYRGCFDQNGKLTSVIGMIADITRRKEAENSLKTLSGRLIEAQEQERRRIARDLHDDINQRLAILNIEFQRLLDDPPTSRTALRERIEELSARSTEISTEVSALTQELHSPKLELLGIVAAMQCFCEDAKKLHKININFQHSGIPHHLDRGISLCLFRIFQESLQNAAKHSGAKVVDAELTGTAHEISLKISDQGIGFELEAAQNGLGLGLVSMQERVSLLKGTICIKSKRMAGTTIHVRIPISG